MRRMAVLALAILSTIILAAPLPQVGAAAFTRGKDVHRFGLSTAGYFTFSQDFKADAESWAGGILTMSDFQWGGFAWGSLGFGVDAGATLLVQQVAADRIDLLVTNPTAWDVNVYVRTPGKASPGSVLGTASWSFAGDVVTVVAGPGSVPLVLLYGGGGGGGGGGPPPVAPPVVFPPFTLPVIPVNPYLPLWVQPYVGWVSGAAFLFLLLTRESKKEKRKRNLRRLSKSRRRGGGLNRL